MWDIVSLKSKKVLTSQKLRIMWLSKTHPYRLSVETLTMGKNSVLMTQSFVKRKQAIATQEPDVPAYTKCDVQLIKLLLMVD
jgi:hypothetical protein